MDFAALAISASKHYYNYLEKNNGSLIIHEIESLRCKDNYVILKMKNKLLNLDMLQIKINADIFTYEQIQILEYNEERRELITSPKLEFKSLMLNANIREIKVIVDLRFLVKNVERFYNKFGYLLEIPRKDNHLSYKANESITEIPSEEQVNAINCALQNPLSYIWGAPGTGKTRFVLSNAILMYAKQKPNDKILITAPTNNAVEQALFGVLPVLKENGYDLEKVLRLGVPSADFASEYPECCEHKKIENHAKAVMKKVEAISNEIETIKESIATYQLLVTYSEELEKLKTFEAESESVINQLLECHERFVSTKEDIATTKNSFDINKGCLSQTQNDKKILDERINIIKQQITNKSKGLSKFLSKKKVLQLRNDLVELDEKVNNLEKEIQSYNKSIAEYNSYIISAESNLSLFEHKFDDFKKELSDIAAFDDKIQNSVKYFTIYNVDSKVIQLRNSIQSQIDNYKVRLEQYSESKNQSLESLFKKLESLEKLKVETLDDNKKLLEKSSYGRISECKILATTIDNCIARLIPERPCDFYPNHIFLDEAGYCPIIKAVTLFAYNAPITMLGDHMQLPPVCEMNDDQFTKDNEDVVLFAQSAIFSEMIYDSKKDILTQYYRNPNAYEFINTKLAVLNHSFRFGEALAKILSKSVYSEKFSGSRNITTNIYFINANKEESPKTRSSHLEVTEIKKFIQSKPYSEIDYNSIGIITPYKQQRRLLRQALPPEIDVLTVHQSQGREWNTVIFSVVDTTNKWFTNSRLEKSKGINVINTAVSRAKKDLIIVCDYDYWKSQENQLIGQIVNVGNKISSCCIE